MATNALSTVRSLSGLTRQQVAGEIKLLAIIRSLSICEDFCVGIDIKREHIQIQVQMKTPIGVATKVDTPGSINLGKKLIQISLGFHVAIPGHCRKQELQSRFINKHKGIGIQLLEPGQLNVDPPWP